MVVVVTYVTILWMGACEQAWYHLREGSFWNRSSIVAKDFTTKFPLNTDVLFLVTDK